ncbi:MAG: S-adenosylmethionine:tRNA ribosyltransferase-isomerase [Candidatus Amulumruptor caecigallinarius]|nr:S-adenosylmethionine:tRNA ribosyltransferase-isomerase [Candidatus Amulumruptor caecigallinarius]MCM1397144.1 S-adenosylmethionine:tRNA ribosyltransferase-isomerase [Candidatus Amulumruptor caecigallinarius]MCM1453167.1 S-adenosylmethionine:tRNA ribosyltransferase-isomerase [bacterium]
MSVTDIDIAQYDYPLPDARIAKHPLADRESCLLLVRGHDGELSTHRFAELPGLLPEDSMLVCNNTRVINARLRFRKGASADGPGGALIEVFCLEPFAPRDYALSFAAEGSCEWTCMVGNSKKWKSGTLCRDITLADGSRITLTAKRTSQSGATSTVRFSWLPNGVTFSQIISAAGEIPIPPYLNRSTEPTDSTDYQTVYSHIEGSVAAPTAGLHFTDALLAAIAARGIPRHELTLHVGAGTFQPVKADTIGGHRMHSEVFEAPRSLIEALAQGHRRVIAVGTTSVRTLESLYHLGCMRHSGDTSSEVPQWYPYSESHPGLTVAEAMQALLADMDASGSDTVSGSTRLIIAPGYTPRVVSGMVTNFHQPRSTLLLLVSTFTGGDWRRMYDYALAGDFRFLSYGDACLLL